MRPLRTLSTVLEMIKFGLWGDNIFCFKELPFGTLLRVSTVSAGRVISATMAP